MPSSKQSKKAKRSHKSKRLQASSAPKQGPITAPSEVPDIDYDRYRCPCVYQYEFEKACALNTLDAITIFEKFYDPQIAEAAKESEAKHEHSKGWATYKTSLVERKERYVGRAKGHYVRRALEHKRTGHKPPEPLDSYRKGMKQAKYLAEKTQKS